MFGQALEQHYYEVLQHWLKCYNQPGMSKAKDKQGRTIWYHVSVILWFIKAIVSLEMLLLM